MWSIISWDRFLLSLVFIRFIPLERRPQANARDRLELDFIYFSPHSHSHPGEVGNSTGRVRRDPRGRVPGASTDFNPRRSPAAWFSGRSKVSHCRPGQSRCLTALPKAAPRRWRSRSPKGAAAPSGSWRALAVARLSGRLPVLLVFG